MTPTPATVTGSFAYEGTKYEARLCDQHGEMFDRDMLVWARLSSEVEVTSEWAQQTKSLADVSRPVPAPVPAPPPEAPPQTNGRSIQALDYSLTFHARERMAERNININDIYQLLDAPAIRRIGSTPGTHVYLNGEIAVVVNEDQAKVITVANRTEGSID